jgi:hypothetical protein
VNPTDITIAKMLALWLKWLGDDASSGADALWTIGDVLESAGLLDIRAGKPTPRGQALLESLRVNEAGATARRSLLAKLGVGLAAGMAPVHRPPTPDHVHEPKPANPR